MGPVCLREVSAFGRSLTYSRKVSATGKSLLREGVC